MQTFTLYTIAALLSLVNAHGIVQHVTANGQTITSPLIGASAAPGAFWLVSDNSPVTDTTDPSTLCGRVATKSSSSLSVSAGSTLSYYWSSGYSATDTLWPHNTGPMMFYMAACNGNCNDIDGSTQFFKLQQYGFESSGVWQQADVHAGKTVDFTVPQDLKPGDYVIRHEIINLASTAEMFPSCLTVTVTGSGTKVLSGQAAQFPGAYQASDPGLTVAGAPVYSIKDNAGYVFPGPAVSSLGQGSSSGGSSSEPATSPSSSSSASTTPTQVLQGAGADPASATTDVSSSASATATPASTDPTGSSTDPSSSPSTSSTSSTNSTSSVPPSGDSTPGPSSGPTTSTGASTLASCAQAWQDCNSKYDGSAEAQANYTCQKDYNTCVAASMSNGNVRRMHRRHRIFANAVSH